MSVVEADAVCDCGHGFADHAQLSNGQWCCAGDEERCICLDWRPPRAPLAPPAEELPSYTTMEEAREAYWDDAGREGREVDADYQLRSDRLHRDDLVDAFRYAYGRQNTHWLLVLRTLCGCEQRRDHLGEHPPRTWEIAISRPLSFIPLRERSMDVNGAIHYRRRRFELVDVRGNQAFYHEIWED